MVHMSVPLLPAPPGKGNVPQSPLPSPEGCYSLRLQSFHGVESDITWFSHGTRLAQDTKFSCFLVSHCVFESSNYISFQREREREREREGETERQTERVLV